MALPDRLRRLAVPAIVLALPLEFTNAYLPFHLDLGRLVIAAAVAVLLLDLVRGGGRLVLPRAASAALLGLFVVVAAASWALTRSPGSPGALAALLAYPLLTLLVLNLVRTEADHRAVLGALIASGVAVALIGLALRATGHFLVNPDPSGLGRVNATFYDPDILARFLAMTSAAGLIVAGGPFHERWRVAALASALLAAAVLPFTFSRVGLLMILLVALAAVWTVRPTRLALAGAVGVVAASFLVVGAQPQVRDRALNLWMFIQVLAAPGYQPPLHGPADDGGPIAIAKTCGVSPDWSVAPDPTAQYGSSARLAGGSRDVTLVAFGQPLKLPEGKFHAWARVRVDDPTSRIGQLREGVWDPQGRAFVQGAYQEVAPAGFSRDFRWLFLGTLNLPTERVVQFRAQAMAPTTTAWYLDQFAVTSPDQPGSVRPAEPWGSAPAELAGLSATAASFQKAADPDAIDRTAAALPRGAATGSSAMFAFPRQPAPGSYRLWAHLRLGSPGGSQPELQASLVDASSGRPLPGSTAQLRPSDGCASYDWAPLGQVTLPAGASVEARLTSVGPSTTDWHVDRVALVPAAGPGSGDVRLAAARSDVRSPFRSLVDRLPLDDQRRYLIVGGLDMFRDHPLTGVGFGGFQHNLLTRYAYDILPGYHDTLSHNALVTILAELGLVGLALLLIVALAVLREVRRRTTWPPRLRTYAVVPGVLLGLIVADSLFEGRLFTEPYLWVMLGLLYSATLMAADERRGGARLSVLVLTHYYPPEVGAPQARLRELAGRLQAQGVDVTVLTCFPNYPALRVAPEHRGRAIGEERLDGIRVIRTWVWAHGSGGFLRRLANQVSFAASSLLALGRCERPDVILVESPPLTTGLAALAYSWLKRAPFVFNVSDIWPQSAVDLGALRNPLAIRLAEAFEMHLYRRAAFVSVVTNGILERLAERGVPREKLYLLTNGVDTSFYRPGDPDPELVRELGLEGRKVVLYAGTQGLAQGLSVVLDAARLVRDPRVVFLLVGDGVEKRALEARAAADGIENVRFLPSRPREEMPRVLNLALATLVPLRRLPLFRGALPSKMFEAMACGKPIVLAVWGEAADLVERAGCGIVVEPEDAPAIAAAVDRLAADPGLAAELGLAGRRLALERFDRELLAERCLELLRLAAGRAVRA